MDKEEKRLKRNAYQKKRYVDNIEKSRADQRIKNHKHYKKHKIKILKKLRDDYQKKKQETAENTF